jgi:hypothetical protein
VVAAFNLQGFRWDRSSRSMQPNGAPGEVVPAVSASVGPKDFEVPPPADADVRWAVLSTHWAVSGELIKRGVALMAYDERSRVLLEPKQCAIYTFAPVGSVGSAGGGGGRVAWAVLGMEDMFNAGGALVDASVDDETSQLHLVVRGVGSLLLYASQRPSALSLDGASAEVLYDGCALPPPHPPSLCSLFPLSIRPMIYLTPFSLFLHLSLFSPPPSFSLLSTWRRP